MRGSLCRGGAGGSALLAQPGAVWVLLMSRADERRADQGPPCAGTPARFQAPGSAAAVPCRILLCQQHLDDSALIQTALSLCCAWPPLASAAQNSLCYMQE